MIQTRRARAALLLALTLELALAGWWRWPWTAAPIETAYEYGSGHVAVVSENWRRSGALRQHFLPVMSIDRELPEWPYRTLFSHEYYSVPPLAFILHYAATRIFPAAEPVLLAKLLAQALIALSVLAAAALLASAYDAWSIFVGLSFLASGVPYLVWYANGYFAVNVGLAAQLVLAGWCAAAMAHILEPDAISALGRGFVLLGGALAFAGAFADYMPLAGDAVAVGGLLIAALFATRAPGRRRFAWRSAVAVACGSAIALATTLVLYGRQMGFERYRQALAMRVEQRSGEAAFWEHVDVVRRQMLTAWPAPLLALLAAAALGVVVWSAASVVRQRSPAERATAWTTLFVLAVAAVPSIGFHYRAINYVRLHWWFAGTWTAMFALALCALVHMVRRRLPAASAAALTAALAVLIVAVNVRFTAAQTTVDPVYSDAVKIYRTLGRELPHDGLPLVITDVTVEWPGLFEDFPFATAYLRRPVLLREADGLIRLPVLHAVYEGKPLIMGGEDAAGRLSARGGDVYVAYDPDARRCRGIDVPTSTANESTPIAVCRVAARDLVRDAASAIGPLSPGYACSAPPAAPTELHVVSIRGGTVVIDWSPSASHRVSYVLEVGRTAGQSDALVASVGRTTGFTARGVLPGRYVVRVRGRNRCGDGAPSNELTVAVE